MVRRFQSPTFCKQIYLAANVDSTELNKYTGTYQATVMPITVICTTNGPQLRVETKGQAFACIPINKHLFMNRRFGYFFLFNPDKYKLLIKEKTNIYYLKKRRIIAYYNLHVTII